MKNKYKKDFYKNKKKSNYIKNFKNHSNNLKNNLYEKYNGDVIMEFGAGLLNDLMRWKNNNIKKVYAIEIDKYSIDIGMKRYNEISKKIKLPEIIYIQADLSIDKIYENKILELLEGKIDNIYSNFSFHYFLRNEKSFNNIKDIIKFFLKKNGKFIYTGLNGKKLFSDLKEEKIILMKENKNTLFKIEKLYNEKEEFKNLGQEINVFVISIGIPHLEYLINEEYIENNIELELKEKNIFPSNNNLNNAEKQYNSYMFYSVFINTY
jgi:hypothetical protein